MGNNLDSSKYKYCSKNQRSEYSPEKYFMLEVWGDFKKTKYENKNKKIVHTQSFFYPIGSLKTRK